MVLDCCFVGQWFCSDGGFAFQQFVDIDQSMKAQNVLLEHHQAVSTWVITDHYNMKNIRLDPPILFTFFRSHVGGTSIWCDQFLYILHIMHSCFFPSCSTHPVRSAEYASRKDLHHNAPFDLRIRRQWSQSALAASTFSPLAAKIPKSEVLWRIWKKWKNINMYIYIISIEFGIPKWLLFIPWVLMPFETVFGNLCCFLYFFVALRSAMELEELQSAPRGGK